MNRAGAANGGQQFPTSKELEDTIAGFGGNIYTHRIAFPRVGARRTNGHVQGIAGLFTKSDDGSRSATLYTSISDFPTGWSACLIEHGIAGTERGVSPDTETLAIPQGQHAGGINVCDHILTVPLEHEGQIGRVLFYDLQDDPRYPKLMGSIDGASTRPAEAWPDIAGSDMHKASAASMAYLRSDEEAWVAPQSSADSSNRYVVVVLSENRFLRFFEVRREGERMEAVGRPIGVDTNELGAAWPTGWVDNASLLNTAEGWRLVVFSAQNLVPLLNVQRSTTRERIDVFDLVFTNGAAHLTSVVSDAHMRIERTPPASLAAHAPDLANRFRSGRSRRDFCWPSFRWGASMSWTGDEFALLVTEWFGDEESLGSPRWSHDDADETASPDSPPAEAQPGQTMYVQFATNLSADPFGFDQPTGKAAGATFGYRHALESHKPPIGTGLLRGLREAPAILLFLLQQILLKVIGESQRKRLDARAKRRLGGFAFLIGLAVMACSLFLPGLVLKTLAAAIGGLIALIGVGFYAVGTVRGDKPPNQIICLVLAVLCAAATLVFFLLESPIGVGIAAALTAVFAGLVWERWAISSERKAPPQRAFWLVCISFVASTATAIWLAVGSLNSMSAIYVLPLSVILFVFLTVAKIAATPAVADQLSAFRLWLFGTAVTAVVVLVGGVAVGGFTDVADSVISVSRFVVGWVGVFTLSVWGAAEFQRKTTPSRFAWAGPGLVLVLVSFALTNFIIPDLGVSLIAVGMAAVLGWYFVWPGEGGLTFALVALFMLFAAIDTDAGESELVPLANATPDGWIVAIGDSFISGEGADVFYDGTNIPGRNLCRRSPTAWPVLVTESMQANDYEVELQSFACSGAELSEGVLDPQATTKADPGGLTPVDGESESFDGSKSQLDALDEWLDPSRRVDYIFVSAGGNDAQFVPVIEACLLPGNNCADLIPSFIERAAVVETNMIEFLSELDRVLEENLGESAQRPAIVVNTYLDPIGPELGSRCGSLGGVTSLMDEREVDAVRDFRGQLNTRIRRGVRAHVAGGANFVTEIILNEAGASVPGRLCQGSESGVNWLSIQPPDVVAGSFHEKFAALVPRSMWIHGSVHPNELGHELLADSICSAIAETSTDSLDGRTLPRCLEPTDAATDPPADAFVIENLENGEGIAQGLAEFPAPTCRIGNEDIDLDRCDLGGSGEDPSEIVNAGFVAAAGRLAFVLSLALLGGILIGAAGAERRFRPPPSWLMPILRRLGVVDSTELTKR